MKGLLDRIKALGGLDRQSSTLHGHLRTVRGGVKTFLDDLAADPQTHALPRLGGAQRHLLSTPGKLVRPLVVWLLGRALDVPIDRLRPYCLVVELLHNATLLHDDVIDRAELRRNRPTANARYDNTLAVLAGDSLLAEVSEIVSALGDIETMRAVSATLRDLVAGEAWQYDLQGVAHDNVQICLEVGELKTGSLLSLCTWIPARLANLAPEERESFASMGRYVGVSFQLIDDVLDFAEGTGKPRLADWHERKTNAVTAVLLRENPSARSALDGLFSAPEAPTPEACEAVLGAAFTPAQLEVGLETVRGLASDYAALAGDCARLIPAGRPGDLYRRLQRQLLERLA